MWSRGVAKLLFIVMEVKSVIELKIVVIRKRRSQRWRPSIYTPTTRYNHTNDDSPPNTTNQGITTPLACPAEKPLKLQPPYRQPDSKHRLLSCIFTQNDGVDSARTGALRNKMDQ